MKLKLALAVGLLLAASAIAWGQGGFTVYSQTTLNCQLTSCSNAEFTPAATLSYTCDFIHMGDKAVPGSVTWNGTTYTTLCDMTWKGYGNHYPYGDWQVTSTFNGSNTLTEDFYCFRSCGSRSNHSGEVVITQ